MITVLLDSNSLINRAYYAMPNLTSRSGKHTGAIFGYMNMLLKIISDYKPTHIIAAFDRKAPVFRKAMYEGYKAQRKGMPDELAEQMQPMKDILTAMNIPIAEMDGFEADDLIGSLSMSTPDKVYIVTGDKDSLQLVSERVNVLLTKKGVSEIDVYTPQRLALDKLTPSQVIDLKSLMGDTSDNIPGVRGIGEKTAKDLLEKYGDLDGVYAHIDEIKGKLREKLEVDKDMAYLSYKLATIKTDIQVPVDLDSAKLIIPFPSAVRSKLQNLDLYKLAERMQIEQGQEPQSEKGQVNITQIDDMSKLREFIARIKEKGKFALHIDGDISLALDESEGAKLILTDSLFGEGLDYNECIRLITPLLQDECVEKLVYDLKSLMHRLDNYDIKIEGRADDVMLLAYLDDANRTYKSVSDMLQSYNADSDCIAAGICQVAKIAAEGIDEKDMRGLYENIELPLVPVLYGMEKQGFRVDKQGLELLEKEFDGYLSPLTASIIEIAGEDFNLNSTQQLGRILFEKLGLKSGKKNKTGYSTSVEVLSALESDHPIIPMVLRYREISKLRSTYVYGLIPLMDSEDKLHTVFKQAVTSTGRLSSTEPNLQNIPVRKKEGALIRRLFLPSKGNKLVTADYSQIELRLMALFSRDPSMTEAFNEGRDIHADTAAKVFGVDITEVTADMRRQAKAVNFGIIYGISEFGLARDLGISFTQAKAFMRSYFATYPTVKEFMKREIEQAKEKGYAVTMFNRRRDLPEISASNAATRSFGERVALNMPLQGSASDIIKMAMIAVDKRLRQDGYKAKMIMQVHDELIIDTPPDEVERVCKMLKECMENVVKTDVKLVADVGAGDNWLDAK
ncbi:MAG: DNA polymerase I [Clostridia bacterium]|nr:DNA polymerase I [Clostridia bacterium]